MLIIIAVALLALCVVLAGVAVSTNKRHVHIFSAWAGLILLVAGLFAPSLAKFISSGGILKLGTRTDTVFAHDTINVDPASGHQEDGIASDGTETAAEPAEATENIFRDKRNTRKAVRAPKFGKLVVFFIHTDWCSWCRKMEQTTWKDRVLKDKMKVDSVSFVDINTGVGLTKWIDGSNISTDEALVRSGYSGSSIPATVIKRGSYSKTLIGYLAASEVTNALKDAE